MILLCDTRQKAGKHERKQKDFERLGIETVNIALPVGDYMLQDNGTVSVDTKQNLQELYSNVISDRGRFIREVQRAQKAGIKLYILTEHGGGIKTVADVQNWTPKYGKLSGRDVVRRILKIRAAYGVEFLFCDKRQTAKKIIEILTGSGIHEHCKNDKNTGDVAAGAGILRDKCPTKKADSVPDSRRQGQ